MKTSAAMLAVAVFAAGAFAQGVYAASVRTAHDADAAAKERRILASIKGTPREHEAPRDILKPWPEREAEALEDASVVKLPNGRLFAVMRSSIGHQVWTQSRDGGKPYLHPRSPCQMYDWKGARARMVSVSSRLSRS